MENIKTFYAPFSHMIIENFFTDSQIELALNELETYDYLPPEKTGAAEAEDGTPLKKNQAVFIDGLYKENRKDSFILNNYGSTLFTDEFKTACKTHDLLFNYVLETNFDETLVSYYENSDYYKRHCDSAVFTCLLYLFKTPKKFEGGEITFHYRDIEYTPPFKNNMCIVFPSIVDHSVNPVKMHQDDLNKGNGRYCLSKFLDIKGNFRKY